MASLRPELGAHSERRARWAGCAGSCGGPTGPGVSATPTSGYAEDSRNRCVSLDSSWLLLRVKGLHQPFYKN